MLRQLQIENFGLIERADVEFADGATIFTGETGSGKTMLLGALGLALGTALAIFLVARSVGWIAHVIEQYESGALIRPRGRYTGRRVG